MVGSDTAHAAQVWKACFGKTGDFTVVVEEVGDNVDKVTKFRVWRFLLAEWSPVFSTMLKSDTYKEGQDAQITIPDFSATAVDIFLGFLYSGMVEGCPALLVEVAALADKYQIDRLHALCTTAVKESLTSTPACTVFVCADRFHVKRTRCDSLHIIRAHPYEALSSFPALNAEQVETILEPNCLCIKYPELRHLLESWASSLEQSNPLRSIIESYKQDLAAHKPCEDSDNVLATLWKHCREDRSEGSFRGYWVVPILGPGQTGMDTERLTKGEPVTYRKGWVMWMLPHSQVWPRGFSFGSDSREQVSVQVLCSADGVAWHLAAESRKQKISRDSFLASQGDPQRPKWIKLQVVDGEFNSDFHIHGIFQLVIEESVR